MSMPKGPRIAQPCEAYRSATAPDPDPDFMPDIPTRNQPLQPGKQPYGPMPDQDPGEPIPRSFPDDPMAPDEDGIRGQRGLLDAAALMARVR